MIFGWGFGWLRVGAGVERVGEAPEGESSRGMASKKKLKLKEILNYCW